MFCAYIHLDCNSSYMIRCSVRYGKYTYTRHHVVHIIIPGTRHRTVCSGSFCIDHSKTSVEAERTPREAATRKPPCVCVSLFFPSHVLSIIFPVLLQQLPSRNSDPRSPGRHYVPHTHTFSSREEISIFFPRRLAPSVRGYLPFAIIHIVHSIDEQHKPHLGWIADDP